MFERGGRTRKYKTRKGGVCARVERYRSGQESETFRTRGHNHEKYSTRRNADNERYASCEHTSSTFEAVCPAYFPRHTSIEMLLTSDFYEEKAELARAWKSLVTTYGLSRATESWLAQDTLRGIVDWHGTSSVKLFMQHCLCLGCV